MIFFSCVFKIQVKANNFLELLVLCFVRKTVKIQNLVTYQINYVLTQIINYLGKIKISPFCTWAHFIMQYVYCIQLSTYYAILYFKRQVFFFLWTCRTGKRLQGIHKYANQQTKKVRFSSALKSRLFFGRQRKAYSKTWN